MPFLPVERARRRHGAVTAVVLACLVLALTSLVAPVSAGAATQAPPKLKDPEATARQLVTAWLTALKDKDTKEIAASLAPNFQIERYDGSGQDRAEYIAQPATVTSWTLGDDWSAIQHRDTLTVRWSIKVTEQIGDNQFTDHVAPRLTTFVWQDGRWKILSYANFNQVP